MSEGRSGCKGPPTLGYFHQDCWNNLGFSYILAACLNRSLVREIDDRFWPKPPNAFRTGETGHPMGTPHGVNPTAQPNQGSETVFRRMVRHLVSSAAADNSGHNDEVRKKQGLSPGIGGQVCLQNLSDPLPSRDRGRKTVRKNSQAILKTSMTCRWFVENLLIDSNRIGTPRPHGRKQSPFEPESPRTPQG